MSKLDKARIANASAIQPLVAGKFAAYDPSGAYAIPAGWFATGLLYDANQAAKRLGGAPFSWASLFVPDETRKMADCGIVLPDARDALFIAAWRTLGVDPPGRAPPTSRTRSLCSAGRGWPRGPSRRPTSSARWRAARRAFPSATPARRKPRAPAAARRRPLEHPLRLPREGGALSIDAFAIPRDAPHPDEAYALLDFLLRPDIAERDARAARLVSAQAAGQDAILKRVARRRL